jgi:hypothetical protein
MLARYCRYDFLFPSSSYLNLKHGRPIKEKFILVLMDGHHPMFFPSSGLLFTMSKMGNRSLLFLILLSESWYSLYFWYVMLIPRLSQGHSGEYLAQKCISLFKNSALMKRYFEISTALSIIYSPFLTDSQSGIQQCFQQWHHAIWAWTSVAQICKWRPYSYSLYLSHSQPCCKGQY